MQRITLERGVAAAAVACPDAVEAALAGVPIIPGEIEDDGCRYLIAGAVASRKKTAADVIRMARIAMDIDRIPYNQCAMIEIGYNFCTPCILDKRPCEIARAYLPNAVRTLATLIDLDHDVRESYDFMLRKLRGAA